MPLDEAYRVLNIEAPSLSNSGQKVEFQTVHDAYAKLFASNDITNGGSFYLQSKVFRAREAVQQHMQRRGQSTKFETAPPKSSQQQSEAAS